MFLEIWWLQNYHIIPFSFRFFRVVDRPLSRISAPGKELHRRLNNLIATEGLDYHDLMLFRCADPDFLDDILSGWGIYVMLLQIIMDYLFGSTPIIVDEEGNM